MSEDLKMSERMRRYWETVDKSALPLEELQRRQAVNKAFVEQFKLENAQPRHSVLPKPKTVPIRSRAKQREYNSRNQPHRIEVKQRQLVAESEEHQDRYPGVRKAPKNKEPRVKKIRTPYCRRMIDPATDCGCGCYEA